MTSVSFLPLIFHEAVHRQVWGQVEFQRPPLLKISWRRLVEEFRKSVNIWGSNGKNLVANSFWLKVHTFHSNILLACSFSTLTLLVRHQEHPAGRMFCSYKSRESHPMWRNSRKVCQLNKSRKKPDGENWHAALRSVYLHLLGPRLVLYSDLDLWPFDPKT